MYDLLGEKFAKYFFKLKKTHQRLPQLPTIIWTGG
jgi:hypothetical protein